MIKMYEFLNKSISPNYLNILKNSKIVIGVSGGPDSIYLLSYLNHLLNKKVIVCSVNYAIREQAFEEYEYVKQLSRKMNYKFYGKTCAKITNGNVQAIARRERFLFFKDVLKNENYEYLLLGTTLNDLIESFYMNLITNKDTPLFRTMKQMQIDQDKFVVFRPLCQIMEKKMIIKELNSKKVKYFIDHTNEEDKYLRNKVRKRIKHEELFPLILRLIKSEKKLTNWIKSQAKSIYLQEQKGTINITNLVCYDQMVQLAFLRYYFKKELKELIPLRNLGKKIENLFQFINNNKSKGKFRIGKNVYFYKNSNYLKIYHSLNKN